MVKSVKMIESSKLLNRVPNEENGFSLSVNRDNEKTICPLSVGFFKAMVPVASCMESLRVASIAVAVVP